MNAGISAVAILQKMQSSECRSSISAGPACSSGRRLCAVRPGLPKAVGHHRPLPRRPPQILRPTSSRRSDRTFEHTLPGRTSRQSLSSSLLLPPADAPGLLSSFRKEGCSRQSGGPLSRSTLRTRTCVLSRSSSVNLRSALPLTISTVISIMRVFYIDQVIVRPPVDYPEL